MANTVTITKLVDGQRNAVLHVYVASDGAAGELSDQVVVDASSLSGAPTKLTIERICWAFQGFSGRLEFDATADSPAAVLFDGDNGCLDFSSFGGLPDPAGAGSTGDILLTTTGFSASGDEGVLIIEVRKD
jgi:hypothetical protein